jgi:carbon-monoxide dehydrogenase medium subunit
VKPPAFDYVRAATVEDALAALARAPDETKLLAGGQSLVPMMNFRLVRPATLVDINRLGALDHITPRAGGGVRIGALSRHETLRRSPLLAARYPVFAEAMAHVAHPAIRNRGTIGGSLSHADPAAELPMLMLLLDATIEVACADGTRQIAARDFLCGPLTTALTPVEMLVAVELPPPAPRTGSAFAEFSLRRGDYAVAAVGVTLVRDRVCREARIAMIGTGETAIRAAGAEALLRGAAPDDDVFTRAADEAVAGISLADDLHASAAFRAHLLRGMLRDCLRNAWARAA